MDDKIGIWIDHRKAVVVFTSAGPIRAKTIESGLPAHTHYSKRVMHSATGGQQDAGGERGYEERYRQQLHRYYDEVISQLGQPDSLLILGPGEAKLQLKERISHSKSLAGRLDAIETTDKLTDAQIVAKVKEHYGIQLRQPGAIAKPGKRSGKRIRP